MPLLYTPPSTPSSFAVHAALPVELLSSWAMWRPQKHSLLTPPMSSSFHQRRPDPLLVVPTLPPLAHLDLLPSVAPLTPPSSSSMYTSRQPPSQLRQDASALPHDAPHLVDWLDITRTRSARFIAEKTCEMICYLWFSRSSPTSSPYHTSQDTSAFTALQFVASPTFVSFMQKVLETTQVSESVIVLSLYYIHRLKEVSHWFTSGQQGSEFRIAVASLMMANKFLDDNTYTNKTWSEVSGIELDEINKMEREFLSGIDFELCVRKEKYELWLNLLKGMVMAKERDWQRWQRTRLPRTSRLPHPQPNGSVPRTHSSRIAAPSYHQHHHRARSTSPTCNGSSPYPRYPFMFTAPPPQQFSQQPPPTQPSPTRLSVSNKRTAQVAFSPTSATFSQLPSKRPPSMSLEIPVLPRSGPPSASADPQQHSHVHSPLEPLQSFSKMSLGSSSPAPQNGSNSSHNTPVWMTSTTKTDAIPQTLVAAYRVDEQRSASVPQNLYFYALTCSPTEYDDESRYRKARLRYHQPPPPTNMMSSSLFSSSAATAPLSSSSSCSPSYIPFQPSMPLNVQSATSSPHDRHMNVVHPSLPHFHDVFWPQQQQQLQQQQQQPNLPSYDLPAPPPPQPQLPSLPPSIHLSVPSHSGSPVPSAPFANAGPPGVQLCSASSRTAAAAPVYSQQHYNWYRGRQYY